jgi:hypothetical protein
LYRRAKSPAEDSTFLEPSGDRYVGYEFRHGQSQPVESWVRK